MQRQRRQLAGTRVLVTGAAGFIGSHLVERMLVAGAEVLTLDDGRCGRDVARRGPDRPLVCRAPLGSPLARRAVAEFRPQAVVHLAALHYIPYCDQHPLETLEVNALGTEWLLDTLRPLSVHALVFSSTAAVYGFDDEPLDEDRPPAPVDVYGQSKWLAERFLHAFALDRPDVACTALRLFNVYGPGETNPHIVPHLVETATRGGEVVVGNAWPTRDFVHVDDVVEAIVRALGLPAGHRVANVATGRPTSIGELAELVRAAVPGLAVRSDPARARARDGHLVGDASRLDRLLGWRPQVELGIGLRALLIAAAQTRRGGSAVAMAGSGR